MTEFEPRTRAILPWKLYAVTIAQVSIAFSISTFCMMVFMTHLNHETSTIVQAVLMGMMYVFVIFACIKRLISRLSIGALMLMIPIAPLAVLILVVTLLPVIQRLQ